MEAKSSTAKNIYFLIHVAGIYICFLTYGILAEKISTKCSFKPYLFTSLIQSFNGTIIAFFISKVTKRPLHIRHPNPIPKYIKISMLHIIGGHLAYESLKYINYPTLIIGKSCKLIPLVLMNFLLYKKKFHFRKYISILLTTVGVLSFIIFEDKTCESKKNSFVGLIFLIGNLLIDGTINSLQDNLFTAHKIHSFHMMFYSNLINFIFIFLYLNSPFTNELGNTLSFIKVNPSVLFDIILFSVSQCIGQIFIYSTIENYGSVTLATINVSRKIVSILISLLWFNHKLNLMQWVSILTVIMSIAMEVLEKRHVKKTI